MLGSLAEADDAVQETWLRLSRNGSGDIANLAGWLTTVVGRLCLDVLRTRTAHPEQPLPAHLPDPVVGPTTAAIPNIRRCWPTRSAWPADRPWNR